MVDVYENSKVDFKDYVIFAKNCKRLHVLIIIIQFINNLGLRGYHEAPLEQSRLSIYTSPGFLHKFVFYLKNNGPIEGFTASPGRFCYPEKGATKRAKANTNTKYSMRWYVSSL